MAGMPELGAGTLTGSHAVGGAHAAARSRQGVNQALA